MRKSVGLALTASVVALATFIGVPSWQASQDRKWLAAGQQALSQVSLPAAYRSFKGSPCEASSRCFAVTGDPQPRVAVVQAALTSLASGPIRKSCRKEVFDGLPDHCQLEVPVRGSKLFVFLFARMDTTSGPPQPGRFVPTYHGSVVQVGVLGR